MSEVTTLEVGQPAPRFSCLDSQGQTHDLESYMEQGKSVILYFYPRDSTPGCTKQACDFRDSMSRINKDDYVVLGVSKDSAKSHDKFINKQDLNFPLLMDEDGVLHEAYGTWRLKKIMAENTWVVLDQHLSLTLTDKLNGADTMSRLKDMWKC